MTETPVHYLGSTDADPDDDFANHSVGVDSSAGLYVIDQNGNELNFSPAVQEQIFEALQDCLQARGSI